MEPVVMRKGEFTVDTLTPNRRILQSTPERTAMYPAPFPAAHTTTTTTHVRMYA